MVSFCQYGAKASIKHVRVPRYALTEKSWVQNRSERAFTCLSQECIPLPLPACMSASSEPRAVTCAEEQCGCERAGECRGCHNRKHGDITCPSGVTEADGAGMRLYDPRGIWLRRQGVLSSFLRQREEESGAGLAVCVLSDGTKRHQQTLWFGERWISAHSPAAALCPEVQLAEGEGASESFQGHTGVGEGATCKGLPGSQQMPEGQANSACRLQGPFMRSFFKMIRSFRFLT